MEFYLKEAFKSLKLLDNERLDEEDFNLTADQGVIDELQSFVADDIEAPAEEEIIDVEADEVEDLQDNYVGKVILECDCCHTRIYKDIADVIIDEETGLANVEEECPVCSNAFGWNVIGKIEPFKEGEFDEEETEEVEVEEVPEDDQELSDEEIGEALKEALGKREKSSLPLREDINKIEDDVRYCLNDFIDDLLNDDAEPLVDRVIKYVPEYDENWCGWFNGTNLSNMAKTARDEWLELVLKILFEKAPRQESFNESYKNEECEECDEACEKEEALKEAFEDPNKVGVDPDRAVEDDEKLEEPMENPVVEDPAIALAEELKEEVIDEAPVDPELKAGKPEKVGKWEYSVDKNVLDKAMDIIYNKLSEEEFELLNDNALNAYIDKDPEALGVVKKIFRKYRLPMWVLKAFAESWDDQNLEEDLEKVQSEDAEKLEDPKDDPVKDLNEGIENLSLDTEDTHMEMTSDDDGKVTVVTEPIHEDEEVVTDEVEDEMIAPLDPEEISQIDNNEEQSAEEVAIEDEIEKIPEEDELDIDEFDEESFDEMGESYLHRVYENVDSFKTSKVSYNDKKLVVEGVITFKSGKEKATSFIFENLRTTKRGKIISEGLNKTFSKSKRAFVLRGSLVDGKFIGESLTYNYNVKQLNESNDSEVVRVYGRAITKK